MSNADVRAFQRVDSRGAYLVLGVGETRDECQLSGEWIATDSPTECLP